MMHFKKHTLKNGLRVLFVPMQDVESATVMIMTGTGSRFENADENGMAHFLEHMYFKGTEKRPDKQDIARQLDAVGGAYNAFTGKSYTGYYAKVPAVHADMALDVVSDIFLNSTLPSREITKERGAIMQEINMYQDMPARDVFHVLDEVMFGDHPLGRAILGPKENIKKFTRKQFLAYRDRCYTSHNTVVCVAGKFSMTKALKQIRADFVHMPSGPGPEYEVFIDTQDAPRVKVKDKKTDQTHMVLGLPTFGAEHPDRYALSVLTTILSGGMSSRLFMEIREKRGLAYSVYASREMHQDIGEFFVKAGVEHENLAKIIKLICAELKKLKRTPISAQELKDAKEHLKGGMMLGLETTDDIAEYFISQEVTRGHVRVPADIAREVDAVTAEDVQRVAQSFFRTEKLNLAVVGPHGERAKELQSLLKV